MRSKVNLKYLNIQALRAGAALAVVGHHLCDYLQNYIAIGAYPRVPFTLACGVDVFFVISGFIMAETSSSARPAAFLRARIARVAPLYWLFSALAAALLASGVHVFGLRELRIGHVVSSFLFLPYFPSEGANGYPILFVGWSLNYELLFYVCFALCLFLKTGRLRMLTLSALFVLLWLAKSQLDSPYLRYWGDPIIAEFLAGMLLSRRLRARAIPHWAAWLAGLIAIFAIAATEWLEPARVMRERAWLWGVPATVIVASAVALEHAGRRARNAVVQSIANGSYAIYLSHPFALAIVGKMSSIVGLHGSLFRDLASAVLAGVASVVGGMIVHRSVERRLVTHRPRSGVSSVSASDPARMDPTAA